jgi:hypothetical protein
VCFREGPRHALRSLCSIRSESTAVRRKVMEAQVRCVIVVITWGNGYEWMWKSGGVREISNYASEGLDSIH